MNTYKMNKEKSTQNCMIVEDRLSAYGTTYEYHSDTQKVFFVNRFTGNQGKEILGPIADYVKRACKEGTELACLLIWVQNEDNKEVLRDFCIPLNWLEIELNKKGMTLEQFVATWNPEDSESIYKAALLSGVTPEIPKDYVVNATFTSVWDGGYEVTTNCKVDLYTKEVFDIEMNDSDEIEALDTLDNEYITINGNQYPVFNLNDFDISNDDDDFWYQN